MTKRRIATGLAVAGSLAWASAAAAHDFFLLPDLFTWPGAGTVGVRATVGSTFPVPENVVPADRAERAVAFGAGNPRVAVAGATRTALNLRVTGARPGLLALGIAAKPRDVEYAEDRIPLILGEYRFLPKAAAAVEALPRPRTWKVSSRRFAKTFICVQACSDRSTAERSFGAHLEFVGSRSSASHFRLLGHGRPLANYPVDLVDADGKRLHLATDVRGDVHLPANARGMMMLFAAKLEPPAGAERFTLDLTSLTFSRP